VQQCPKSTDKYFGALCPTPYLCLLPPPLIYPLHYTCTSITAFFPTTACYPHHSLLSPPPLVTLTTSHNIYPLTPATACYPITACSPPLLGLPSIVCHPRNSLSPLYKPVTTASTYYPPHFLLSPTLIIPCSKVCTGVVKGLPLAKKI